MNKLLTLTFAGLLSVIHTAQAGVPDLNDLVPINMKAAEDQRPIQQAAAAILWANAGKPFRSLSKDYNVEFNESERAKFEAIFKTSVQQVGLACVMKALNEETLHLEREDAFYTLSDAADNTASFFMGTAADIERTKNIEFQADIPDLSDYGYTSEIEDISGASHIIRAAASKGAIVANLQDGTTYQFYIPAKDLEKLETIKKAFGGFSNKAVTQALKDQRLSLSMDFNLCILSATLPDGTNLVAKFLMDTEKEIKKFLEIIASSTDNKAQACRDLIMDSDINWDMKDHIVNNVLKSRSTPINDEYLEELCFFLNESIIPDIPNFTQQDKLSIYHAAMQKLFLDDAMEEILREIGNFDEKERDPGTSTLDTVDVYIAYLKNESAEFDRTKEILEKAESFLHEDSKRRLYICCLELELELELEEADHTMIFPVTAGAILEKVEKFSEDAKSQIYSIYLQRSDAKAETILEILEKTGNFSEIAYKANIYQTYLRREVIDGEVAADILKKTAAFPSKEHRQQIYEAYLQRNDTDNAIISQVLFTEMNKIKIPS